MNISGSTVLITGGGSGIGLALTEELVRNDNKVIICGRRRNPLKEAQKRLPGVDIRVCDVTRKPSRKGLVDWILSNHKKVNILINNAGIQRTVDFLKGTEDLDDADSEIATNLSAPIHLSAMMIPHLKRKKEAAVINISSGLGFTPIAAMPVYCATKAAIHSWSLSLRHQLRGTCVKVFEIVPPMVSTELGGDRERGFDDEDMMSAEECAAGILNALKKDSFEAPLGDAAGLMAKREQLFHVLNR